MLCSYMLKINVGGDSSDCGAMKADVFFDLGDPLVLKGNIRYYSSL